VLVVNQLLVKASTANIGQAIEGGLEKRVAYATEETMRRIPGLPPAEKAGVFGHTDDGLRLRHRAQRGSRSGQHQVGKKRHGHGPCSLPIEF